MAAEARAGHAGQQGEGEAVRLQSAPGGHTASYDALETALGYDVEAIYFLSDGDPNAGKISVPDAIIAAIVQANHMRRVSVYTIGICPGAPGGPLDTFMRSLAEQNLGIYRRVDK